MHLLVGRHLDLPVALGLVRVVLGVVGSLDGHLVHNRKISHVTSGEDQGNLLSISQVALSVFAAQSCIPGICRLEKTDQNQIENFFYKILTARAARIMRNFIGEANSDPEAGQPCYYYYKAQLPLSQVES